MCEFLCLRFLYSSGTFAANPREPAEELVSGMLLPTVAASRNLELVWSFVVCCRPAFLEFQLPPALPRGPTSDLLFWAPGIILFHCPQGSSMEWVKTRSLGLMFKHEMWSRSVRPDELSRSLSYVDSCMLSMLSSASRTEVDPGHLSAGKKANLSRYSPGFCSQLSGGNRPGITPSN